MSKLPPPPPKHESFDDMRERTRDEKRETDLKKNLRGAVMAALVAAGLTGFAIGLAYGGAQNPTTTVATPAPVVASPTPTEPVATPEQTKVQADTMLANWELNGVTLEEVCALTDDDWAQVRRIWESQGANPVNAAAVEEEIRRRCEAA